MAPEFTPEQRSIIDLFGESQSIVAGAGCGKTTTLVGKCIQLLRINKNARFCVVSFTDKSIREFREAIAKGLSEAEDLGLKFDSSKYWVKTFHGLCGTILREFPREAGLDGGEKILEETAASKYWRQALDVLWSTDQNQELTDAIAVLIRDRNRESVEKLLKRLHTLRAFGALTRFQEADSLEVQALLRCYESVSQRFQNLKRRAGVLDFSDMEVLAEKALQNPRVVKAYQNEFDLILVDEFQDTNPIQGRILNSLCKPNQKNLCIVGDPKQSIYRFRDADVSVFEEFVQRSSQKQYLSTNYRSDPEIIEFVNGVCDPLFQAMGMQYDPLTAGRKSAASAEAPPLDNVASEMPPINYAAGGAPQLNRVVRWNCSDMEDLADKIFALHSEGADLGQLVILTRKTTTKIVTLIKSLKAKQVPYLIGGTGRFWNDPRVQEIVALLRAWFLLDQRLSAAEFLRAPWIHVEDSVLQTWLDSDLIQKYFESDSEFAQYLKPLWNSRFLIRPGQLLEKILAYPELPEEMRLPVLALWNKSEEFSLEGSRNEEIVREFAGKTDELQREAEIPLPGLTSMLRIMTVHASKGLQFPNVLLIDFDDGSFSSSKESASLYWDRAEGAYLPKRDIFGKIDSEDPLNGKWKELEARHRVAESQRLFYVALTRAQEKLILAWPPAKERSAAVEAKKAKQADDAFKKDFWRGWVEKTVLPVVETMPRLEVGKSDQNGIPAKIERSGIVHSPVVVYRPRHSASEWLLLEKCPRRYVWEKVLSRMPDEADGESSGLENIYSDGLVQKVLSADEKGKELHAHLENEDWDRIPEFASVLTAPGFLYRLPSVKRELGFEVPLNALEACVGVMDRLEWDSENRKIWVADYKWTAKNLEPDTLKKRYLFQIQTYAWAAIRLLETDQSQFKEWKIDASLIHFCGNQVSEVKISDLKYAECEAAVVGLWKASRKLNAAPDQHQPKPSDACSYCPYRRQCSDSALAMP